jgi:hypothetical protein
MSVAQVCDTARDGNAAQHVCALRVAASQAPLRCQAWAGRIRLAAQERGQVASLTQCTHSHSSSVHSPHCGVCIVSAPGKYWGDEIITITMCEPYRLTQCTRPLCVQCSVHTDGAAHHCMWYVVPSRTCRAASRTSTSLPFLKMTSGLHSTSSPSPSTHMATAHTVPPHSHAICSAQCTLTAVQREHMYGHSSLSAPPHSHTTPFSAQCTPTAVHCSVSDAGTWCAEQPRYSCSASR